VKEARGWESAEESVKVVEAREVASARAERGLAVVVRDRRQGKRRLNPTPLDQITA
jgi:hypothetical protein